MHYNERTRSTKLVGFMLSGMLFALTTSVYAGSSSTTVNFSATLVGGSCQISVDRPSITFSPLSSSTVIAAGGDGIDPQLFSMTFSDCSGWGLTPKVQIKGNTFTSGIPLFRNDNAASDYSQGYGVKLVQQGQMAAIANMDKLIVGTADQQLNTLNGQTLNFEARLSCGNCTAGPSLKGGNMNATVTLQFIYE